MSESIQLVNYKGNIDIEVVDRILYDLKHMLKKRKLDTVIRKRVYTLSVECLDNVQRHSNCSDCEEEIKENYPSSFSVFQNEKYFIIKSGNVIHAEDIKRVDSRINLLNSLSQENLNILYKESLSTAEISERGGAGLGLIVMVKTTSEKIDHHFEKINEDFSYFTMKLKLTYSQ